jgi:hypothetical protein
MAAQEGTNMTSLVITALEDFLTARS